MNRVIPYEKLCEALERSKRGEKMDLTSNLAAGGNVGDSAEGSVADTAALGIGTGIAASSYGQDAYGGDPEPLGEPPSHDESVETVAIMQDDILE